MSRWIDADKLKKHYAWWNNEEKKVFDDIVDLQPTVDIESIITRHEDIGYERGYRDGYAEALEVTDNAEPVKHGHWVEENTRTHSMQFKCSGCGGIAYYPQNHHSTESKRCGYAYCPRCGAKMEVKDE